ncbi:MAG TPA: DnaA N-terminal domain-containing protein [Anaerolineae bacterium]|nr:DnaA N-terminal domain-containing protein [Anaerolineae bacterium]
MTPTDLWQQTLQQLKLQMTEAAFETWLYESTATLSGSTLTITAKSAFAKDWLENRLGPTIKRTLARVAGRPLDLAFTGAYPTNAETLHTITHPEADQSEEVEGDHPSIPASTRFAIELVHFNPQEAGYVIVTNYALDFWQPLLGPSPFALWLTLRSFPAAWAEHIKPDWPSIQTIADICARRDRHKILGRAAWTNHHRVIGALEVLESERIVWPRRYGTGRQTYYVFKVLNALPLLTPTQVAKLTPRLQARHDRQLARTKVNYDEWQQLTLPSLTADH